MDAAAKRGDEPRRRSGLVMAVESLRGILRGNSYDNKRVQPLYTTTETGTMLRQAYVPKDFLPPQANTLAAESQLNDFARLASAITGFDMAFVTLFEDDAIMPSRDEAKGAENRGDIQHFVGRWGSSLGGTMMKESFCQHIDPATRLLLVPDATQDFRFQRNKLVKSEFHIRKYAGAGIYASRSDLDNSGVRRYITQTLEKRAAVAGSTKGYSYAESESSAVDESTLVAHHPEGDTFVQIGAICAMDSNRRKRNPSDADMQKLKLLAQSAHLYIVDLLRRWVSKKAAFLDAVNSVVSTFEGLDTHGVMYKSVRSVEDGRILWCSEPLPYFVDHMATRHGAWFLERNPEACANLRRDVDATLLPRDVLHEACNGKRVIYNRDVNLLGTTFATTVTCITSPGEERVSDETMIALKKRLLGLCRPPGTSTVGRDLDIENAAHVAICTVTPAGASMQAEGRRNLLNTAFGKHDIVSAFFEFAMTSVGAAQTQTEIEGKVAAARPEDWTIAEGRFLKGNSVGAVRIVSPTNRALYLDDFRHCLSRPALENLGRLAAARVTQVLGDIKHALALFAAGPVEADANENAVLLLEDMLLERGIRVHDSAGAAKAGERNYVFRFDPRKEALANFETNEQDMLLVHFSASELVLTIAGLRGSVPETGVAVAPQSAKLIASFIRMPFGSEFNNMREQLDEISGFWSLRCVLCVHREGATRFLEEFDRAEEGGNQEAGNDADALKELISLRIRYAAGDGSVLGFENGAISGARLEGMHLFAESWLRTREAKAFWRRVLRRVLVGDALLSPVPRTKRRGSDPSINSARGSEQSARDSEQNKESKLYGSGDHNNETYARSNFEHLGHAEEKKARIVGDALESSVPRTKRRGSYPSFNSARGSEQSKESKLYESGEHSNETYARSNFGHLEYSEEKKARSWLRPDSPVPMRRFSSANPMASPVHFAQPPQAEGGTDEPPATPGDDVLMSVAMRLLKQRAPHARGRGLSADGLPQSASHIQRECVLVLQRPENVQYYDKHLSRRRGSR